MLADQPCGSAMRVIEAQNCVWVSFMAHKLSAKFGSNRLSFGRDTGVWVFPQAIR